MGGGRRPECAWMRRGPVSARLSSSSSPNGKSSRLIRYRISIFGRWCFNEILGPSWDSRSNSAKPHGYVSPVPCGREFVRGPNRPLALSDGRPKTSPAQQHRLPLSTEPLGVLEQECIVDFGHKRRCGWEKERKSPPRRWWRWCTGTSWPGSTGSHSLVQRPSQLVLRLAEVNPGWKNLNLTGILNAPYAPSPPQK